MEPLASGPLVCVTPASLLGSPCGCSQAGPTRADRNSAVPPAARDVALGLGVNWPGKRQRGMFWTTDHQQSLFILKKRRGTDRRLGGRRDFKLGFVFCLALQLPWKKKRQFLKIRLLFKYFLRYQMLTQTNPSFYCF